MISTSGQILDRIQSKIDNRTGDLASKILQGIERTAQVVIRLNGTVDAIWATVSHQRRNFDPPPLLPRLHAELR